MTNTIKLPRINSNFLALMSFMLICVMMFLTFQPVLAQADVLHELHPCYEIQSYVYLNLAAAKAAFALAKKALALYEAAKESGNELTAKLAQKAARLAYETARMIAERGQELLEDLEDCQERHPGPWYFYVASGSCGSGGCGNA